MSTWKIISQLYHVDLEQIWNQNGSRVRAPSVSNCCQFFIIIVFPYEQEIIFVISSAHTCMQIIIASEAAQSNFYTT